MTNNLNKLGNTFEIQLPVDDKGYTERQCPLENCKQVFKVKGGTGLSGEGLKVHCPYCGHVNANDNFTADAQVEYAQLSALNEVMGAFEEDLKTMEFQRDLGLGISISMKIEGQPRQVQEYIHSELETEVVCDDCKLHYVIYGLFGYCPDCAKHNSLQILNINLENAKKRIQISQEYPDLSQEFIEDALKNAVEAFDGFGANIFKEYERKSEQSVKFTPLQKIEIANQTLEETLGLFLERELTQKEWSMLCRTFQKRHLLVHNSGLVDQKYLDNTQDKDAILERKMKLVPEEVKVTIECVKKLGEYLYNSLLT